MFISVLIATRNRPEDLIPCLRSLLAMDYPDFEVVVLDQSTTDASAKQVCAEFGDDKRLRYLPSETTGKSVAMNLLIAAARGEIFACSDDDCEMPADWLRNIVRVFEEVPEADIVFGQVFAGFFGTPDEPAHTPAMNIEARRFLKPGEIAGMGANMAMRRSVTERTGKFDEMLGPGTKMHAAEEGDFIYRAQKAGVRILLEPSVTLVHRAWRSGAEWNRVLFCYGTGDAALALKHVRCWDWRMIRPLFGRYGYIFARLCYRLVCREKHQEEHYLRGYWNGIKISLRTRVDRRARLYLAPQKKS